MEFKINLAQGNEHVFLSVDSNGFVILHVQSDDDGPSAAVYLTSLEAIRVSKALSVLSDYADEVMDRNDDFGDEGH